MENETSRALVTLGAVALGWLLSTITGWGKENRQRRRIKVALLQEIQDIRLILLESKNTLEEALRITLQTGVYDAVPHQTPTHIYKNHFHVVAPYLNLSQRMSFGRIYALVDETNKQYRSINAAFDDVRYAPESPELDAKYIRLGSLIQGSYFNVCCAIAAINHHTQHKKNIPSVTQDDEDALEAQIESNIDQIKKIASGFPDRGRQTRKGPR